MPTNTSSSYIPEQNWTDQQRAEHPALLQLAQQAFPGQPYLYWLHWLHEYLAPKNYVEIGVECGQSLQFAGPNTQAIGIDPLLQISYPLSPTTQLYELTSNDFFQQHPLTDELQGIPLELAFIDGLHTFEQALQDFMHLETHAHPNGVIAFHDIFPVSAITAQRERDSIFWVGDTWKAILILTQARPDLKIITIPTYPSGLTLVTGLNPGSQVLRERYDQLIELCMPLNVEDFIADFETLLNVCSNDTHAVQHFLSSTHH